MSKDINLHVRTTGTPQAKQELDELGKSGQKFGQDVTAGQKQAADATEKSSQKLTGMGRILGNRTDGL